MVVIKNFSKLTIKSKPVKANVYINEDKVGTTPLKLSYLKKGSYNIEVKKKYYLTKKLNLIINESIEKEFDFKLKRGKADLSINTNPKGALVFIDNKKILQKTPVSYKKIGAGEYKLEIKKDGYHPVEKIISLNPYENKKTSFNLKMIKSEDAFMEDLSKKDEVNIKDEIKELIKDIELKAQKDDQKEESEFLKEEFVKIEIDETTVRRLLFPNENSGKLNIITDSSDFKIWLVNEKKEYVNNTFVKEGKYSFVVFKEGYEDYYFDADIKKGETIKKEIKLIPKGRLFVETDIEKSRINIEGKWIKFKQGIYLPKGEYKISIESDKYPKVYKQIKIESNKTKRVKVKLKEYTELLTGMKFIFIKGGCYEMGCIGSSYCSKDEYPKHNVCINDFWMGIYEVTQKQWEKIEDKNPSGFKGNKNNPVEKVSWDAAIAFVEKLTKKNKDGFTFRLPTEAEWEYAARSKGISEIYAGAVETENICWNNNNAKAPMPVGLKQPNYLGLYDMCGNVWEWCLDSYDPDAYKVHFRKNPVMKTDSSFKVFRGGGWYSSDEMCRVSNRSKLFSGSIDTGIGFRVVMEKK